MPAWSTIGRMNMTINSRDPTASARPASPPATTATGRLSDLSARMIGVRADEITENCPRPLPGALRAFTNASAPTFAMVDAFTALEAWPITV